MPIGINNVTTISLDNITDMVNITTQDPMAFFINVNHVVYQGWLYFLLLLVLWVILFFAAQQKKDAIGVNLMYSGAAITVISFFMRAIYITQNGIIKGLITDFQMWIFPLITVIVAVFLYATKE